MTRLEFEREKTKRMAALAEALKGAGACEGWVLPSTKEAIAQQLLFVCQHEFGMTYHGQIKIDDSANEKLV